MPDHANILKRDHETHLQNLRDELLVVLMEECGELVQAASKVLRHGADSFNPHAPASELATNRENLEREMGDVHALLIMLCEDGLASKARVHERADDKLLRLGRWLHHAHAQ